MTINFEVSPEDSDLIHRIGNRAARSFRDLNRLELEMDLAACHNNGNPLDLERLLLFPASDFAHDVYGITEHINRNTGQLGECFSPRCASRTT